MVCKILTRGPLTFFTSGKPNYENLFLLIKKCVTKFHAESTDREPESSVMDPIRDKTVIWTAGGILYRLHFFI